MTFGLVTLMKDKDAGHETNKIRVSGTCGIKRENNTVNGETDDGPVNISN